MRIRIPAAIGALALGLVVATGRPAAAQDVTPPVSQDTSKAEKPRVDTVDVGQPAGYRAMGAPDCKVGEVAVRRDTTAAPLADTAAVAAAAPDSAAQKAAEAAGVYPAPANKDWNCVPADAKPGMDKPIDKDVDKDVKPDGTVKPDGAIKADTTSAAPVVR